MEKFETLISEHPFFKGLEPRLLELIVGCSANVRFNAGEFIAHEGDPADKFYLIRHGRVALEVFVPGRGPITIETMHEGDVLGWSWLIPPYHAHFDARALDLTRAVSVDGKCLRTKCDNDPGLGYEVLKRFSQLIVHRLTATRLQLLDLYGKN